MPKKKLENSLAGLAENLTMQGGFGGMNGIFGFNINPYTPQNRRIDSTMLNTRWALISNFRTVLSEAYTEYGLIQTLVDQPVDDAFRSGFDIKTRHLEGHQVNELKKYIEENRIVNEIAQACKWARLYGGGGIVIMTDQKPDTPLNMSGNFDKLSFRAADLWELFHETSSNLWNPWYDGDKDVPYNYYGVRMDRSRVLPLCGKEAPSFVKPRLRGWGMSELERVVSSMNSYFKNQNVIYELLDEAKIDVYQLNGLNAALLTKNGTRATQDRVQVSNMLKNYLNALILDTNDKYEQKQINFSGLSDILTQIRQGISCDLKMPMTKLFGISSAGFNSGEDDIENYNSMIEGEVRSKVKFIVIKVLEICCQKLFGFIPDDLMIEFKPLRMLSAEQEENVKSQIYNRLISAATSGVISIEQFKIGCNNANLLPIVFSKEEIEASSLGDEGIGFDSGEDKGKTMIDKLMGVFGKKGIDGNKSGATVKIEDVVSNKFTRPAREQVPDKAEAFPYKTGRQTRYERKA